MSGNFPRPTSGSSVSPYSGCETVLPSPPYALRSARTRCRARPPGATPAHWAYRRLFAWGFAFPGLIESAGVSLVLWGSGSVFAVHNLASLERGAKCLFRVDKGPSAPRWSPPRVTRAANGSSSRVRSGPTGLCRIIRQAATRSARFEQSAGVGLLPANSDR